jgi:hypothetical protein
MSAREFLYKAFCDNGTPSSSRILSAWLSLSSMALIWFIVRHMMGLSVDKIAVWIGNLPLVITSLAAFAVSPYGVNRASKMFGRDKDKGSDDGDTTVIVKQ